MIISEKGVLPGVREEVPHDAGRITEQQVLCLILKGWPGGNHGHGAACLILQQSGVAMAKGTAWQGYLSRSR
jgi:hypothetical protein